MRISMSRATAIASVASPAAGDERLVGRRVQMDMRNPMLASPSQRVVLGVGMLMSYEGMGTGMLECVRGCHCAVMHIDCSWDKPMSIKARAGRLRARACAGWDAPCRRHGGRVGCRVGY